MEERSHFLLLATLLAVISLLNQTTVLAVISPSTASRKPLEAGTWILAETQAVEK
jgi:hypothetical protein